MAAAGNCGTYCTQEREGVMMAARRQQGIVGLTVHRRGRCHGVSTEAAGNYGTYCTQEKEGVMAAAGKYGTCCTREREGVMAAAGKYWTYCTQDMEGVMAAKEPRREVWDLLYTGERMDSTN